MDMIPIVLLIPLATSIAIFFLRHYPFTCKTVSVASSLAQLAVSLFLLHRLKSPAIILVSYVGSWSPEVGIVWVIDGLSALMLVLTGITSTAVLFCRPQNIRGQTDDPSRDSLHHLLVFGVVGCFITGDLFNLFVFFEVMLITSFLLINVDLERGALSFTYPYVAVSMLSSMVLLAGVGLLYGSAGTVNIAELSLRVASGSMSTAGWVSVCLLVVAFSLKAALAPFFTWLPDSYPAAPVAVSAFFAGILTKVGVYSLYRIVPLLSVHPDADWIGQLLLVISVPTMIFGVIGAIGSSGIRHILSFHIVSQVGYMIFALTLGTIPAIAAGIFYIFHHIIVKSSLFLAGGAADSTRTTNSVQTKRGLHHGSTFVSATFFLASMSLAGLPPVSGFWAKFFLIKEGFAEKAWVSTGVALVVSGLTLASMLKIWFGEFWRPGRTLPAGDGKGYKLGLIILVGLTVMIGLFASPIHQRATVIARGLVQTDCYISKVLDLEKICTTTGDKP